MLLHWRGFFSPTVLFTLGRYWHRQVSSQLSLHHALYMCSSQTDERGMVGERHESASGEKEGKGAGNRKAAERRRWLSAERRGKSERSEGARKREVITYQRQRRKATKKKRARWRREREARLVNMISVCAAAHPCVELVYSDNRVRWGTLFMLMI